MRFPSLEFDNAIARRVTDKTVAELHELQPMDASARNEYLWRVEVHGEFALRQARLWTLTSVRSSRSGLEADDRNSSCCQF